jgi:hypothetical protein
MQNEEKKFMKTTLILLALVSAFSLQPSALLHAQGSLTPPGAPAPTMKSLDQIEARTPISSAPYTITQPGSYYLTHNLTVSSGDGIDITTNGVTLDLNGFTISSTAASATGNGILLNSGWSDITICNGHIRGGVTNNGSGVYSGSGFNSGIYCSASPPANVLVSRTSVSGCLNFGIFLNTGNSTVVESCTVRTVGSYGINASTVKSSSALDCGFPAISGGQVSDCYGQCSGGSEGINAITAQNCYGYSSSGAGLYAQTAQNCYGSSGTFYGLYASGSATGCYGSSSSGTGISAYNAAFCTGSRPSGTAIQATIANGCIAIFGTNIITYKYNMP